jgi:hypothetical protein
MSTASKRSNSAYNTWDCSMAEPAPSSAPLPTVRVGDRWRFATHGRVSGIRSEETRRVIEVSAERIVCEVDSTDVHAARGRFTYTRHWNLVTRPAPLREGETPEDVGQWRWQPHYPQFDFPLVPGKLWRGTARTSNSVTETINVHRFEGRVLAPRTLAVPAGSYAVLPVRYVADVVTEGEPAPSPWRNEEMLFYAAAVNLFVRAEHRVVDPAGGVARDSVLELLAYEPAPG